MDAVVRSALLLLLCTYAAAESRYVFTAPKALTSASSEPVCLLLLDPPGPGQLMMELLDGDRRVTIFTREVQAETGTDWYECFGFEVPAVAGPALKLRLSVRFAGNTSYSIYDEHLVNVRYLNSVLPRETVHIQTDKAVYKPGQKVLIRLLAVDERLRPLKAPLPLVYVTSPLGTRLAQWRDVQGPAGLVQLEFQLDDDPALGQWKIQVKVSSGGDKEFSKEFMVDEFVLPKFEVQIKGPSVIYDLQQTATWRVCGKYTHGKSVHGVANISVSLKEFYHPYWLRFDDSGTEKVRRSQHTEGNCAVFEIPTSELFSPSCYHQSTRLTVSGSLTEDGTGVTQEAESVTSTVKEHKYRIDGVKQRQEYVKPGLPFTDEVRLTRIDGSAAAGVKLRLCFTLYYAHESRDERRWGDLPQPGFTECKKTTSDSAGSAAFVILLQNKNVTKVKVKAEVSSSELQPAVEVPYNRLNPYYSDYCQSRRSASVELSRSVWYSASGAFVQIDSSVETAHLSCGDTASLPVRVTAPGPGPLTLFYQVMAEGRIVQSDSVSVPLEEPPTTAELRQRGVVFGPDQNPDWQQQRLGSVTLSVPVNPRTSAGISLLVFTHVDGEVIADSHLFEVTPCLQNRISLAWRPERAAPKDSVSLRLTASPGSVCGVDVVDKSANLLSTDNRMSLSGYFEDLKALNGGANHHRDSNDQEYCVAKETKITSQSRRKELPIYRFFPRWDSLVRWKTYFLDSLSAFNSRSWLVLSDLTTESRPCSRYTEHQLIMLTSFAPKRGSAASLPGLPGPSREVALLSVSSAPRLAPAQPAVVADTPAAPQASKPRTYFPETWLFDLHTVGPDGVVTLTPHAPDTITEWVAGAVCSSEADGMGLAAPASITTFQPFFITYTLPYSVKRGEALVLKVSVFNYNDHQLPVRLTLRESDEFETLSAPVLTSCVDAATPEVVSFKLRPRQLGQVNISVEAEVFPDFPGACGPETIVAFSDAVIRPMLVEPEGFERELIRSKFLCLTPEKRDLTALPDELDISWALELPQNLVPGSERAHVTVVGELLGPSLDNLGKLVRKPSGCGEQNMVLFSPNIHVMKYLTAVGELTEAMKQKLTANMKTGYQRELNYRHHDMSFSAFGKSDPSGSMWLTAFVVKSFGDASKFISVDDDDLSDSVYWIEKQQTRGGCFPNVGRVLHKAMKGGVASGGQQALTAYVTAALLSSGVRLRENTVRDAFRCLTEEGSTDDLYTLTLRTYARALAGQLAQARQDMALLNSRAVWESRLMYWRASGRENRALSVEMGAYNVLTMTILDKASDREDFFIESLAAVRWITEQRNSQGGFVSTQDTVLALEALAAFSLRIPRSEDTDLTVHLWDEHGTEETLHVTAANRLLTQRRSLETLPAQLSVRADGTGCGLVQAILKYNVKDPEPEQAFEMRITTSAKAGQKECLKHSIEICVGYTGEDEESNMAVAEVEMVSGFVPSKSSLRELKKDTSLELKRWEVNHNKVAFYFDSLVAGVPPRCFEFRVYREQKVEDVKPAVAKVYDYYETEQQISLAYELDLECREAV